MNTSFSCKICLVAFLITSCHTVIIPENAVDDGLKRNLVSVDGVKLDRNELPDKMDLKIAKAWAIKQNPNLEAAELRILRAKAVIDQAKSLYFPTLTATVGARHQHYVAQSQLPFTIDPYETYRTGLNSQWLIFDGFAREYRLLSAKYGELVAKESYKDSQRLLLDAVTQAFYQLVLSQKEVAVNKEIIEINQHFLKDAEAKFKAGIIGRSEVNNFKVNLHQAEIASLDGENNLAVAKIILLELLGFPEANGANISFTYDLKPLEIPTETAALQTAFNNRPDLKAMQAEILGMEAQVQQIKGEYLPKFYLEGSYGTNSFDKFEISEDRRDAYIGAAMSWDLFTGNSTAAQMAQKIAEKDEKLKLLKARWWQTISEIKQQRHSLQTALNKQTIQEKNVLLTKEIYEDTKVMFEKGSINITRVNEVLSGYSLAKLNFALFEIEVLRRYERLKTLLGTSD